MSRLIYSSFRISKHRALLLSTRCFANNIKVANIRSFSSDKSNELKYPNGKILLTKTGSYSTESHVTFEELVDKNNLRKLVLAAYQLEVNWLMSKLPRNIPICLIRNWQRQLGDKAGTSSLHSNFTVVQPPLPEDRYGSMHAKFLILYYDRFLRVIITSANLTSLDWENFENVLFVQDFQRAKEKIVNAPAFGKDLYSFLGALKVPNFIRNSLTCYDFSTATVSLVPSVPGYHMFNPEQGYGYLRVARILQNYGLTVNPNDNKLKLEYQTSAIGAIDEYWLREFYRSCCGGLAAREVYNLKDLPVDIIYPSQSTIQKSAHAHHHQFHLKEAFYSRSTFPKSLMRDSVCTQPGRLSHSKLFLAKLRKSIPIEATDSEAYAIGWNYIGSHNLSSGAWGKITNIVPGNRFRRIHFRINNFDLGILKILTNDVPIDDPDELQSKLVSLTTLSCISPAPHYQLEDHPYFDPPDFES